MTPEQLVPSRETCERLKAAGYRQDTFFGWHYGEGLSGPFVIPNTGHIAFLYAAPTASELMDELQSLSPRCGVGQNGFAGTTADTQFWAESRNTPVIGCHADSLAEALALLWLKVRESAPAEQVREGK